jgi:RNA polymerase primary sigma factor
MSRTPRRHHRPTAGRPVSGIASSVRYWLESTARDEPLSPVTVLELSRRVQAWRHHPGGAQAAPCHVRRRALRARNQLACHNLRLVSHAWKRHRSGLPLQEEATADALQEAALSLLRAAEKFDPARGYSFSTYAAFWVRHGFSVYQRNQRRLIRLPSNRMEMLLRLRRLVAQYSAMHGQPPSLAWLAERCSERGKPVPVEGIQQLLLLWWQSAVLELDRPLSATEGEGGESLLDVVPDPRGADPTFCAAAALEAVECQELADFPDASAQLASCACDGQDEQRSMLPVLLRNLQPVERRLLWHLYLREHPLRPAQVQRVMGLRPEQQAEVEQRALRKLRAAARAAGMRIGL